MSIIRICERRSTVAIRSSSSMDGRFRPVMISTSLPRLYRVSRAIPEGAGPVNPVELVFLLF